MLNLRTVNIYDKMVFLLIVDIYSVPQSSTPSLVLPTQLPSMKLGDKTMMVLEIDEYSRPIHPQHTDPEGKFSSINKVSSLSCLISMLHAYLFFGKFSYLHGLIRTYTLINSMGKFLPTLLNVQEKLFFIQYLHSYQDLHVY